jgi:hypothetical protein
MKSYLFLLATTAIFSFNPGNSIEKNGVSFSWKFVSDQLICTVNAPASGWVAIGFNEKNQLKGTNLIMGSAEHGFFKMSDRYIVKTGDHQSVIALGEPESLSERDVTEQKNKTTMSFRINRVAKDNLHKNLNPGTKMYLLLAYSNSDDFDHHSSMRTSILITL